MSDTFVVRYQTRPDAADENQRLIEQVFAQLHHDRPTGLRYASFRLDDGVSFVHIATSEVAESPLPKLSAFGEFQRGIGDRVTGPPNGSGATAVGSYRFHTNEQAVTVAVAFIEAFGKNDLATVATLLADDIVFESPRTRRTGAPAVLEAMGEFARAVTGITVVDVFGSGDRAMIMYDMETGPFGTLRAVDYLTVCEGKIVSDVLVFDTHEVRQ